MRSRLAKSIVEWFQAVAERTRAYKLGKINQVSGAATGRWADLLVEIVPSSGSERIRLAVEAQERISPLSAIGILQRMAESSVEGVPTLCSRVISERVAELCRVQGVSYLDEAGNCRLSAPSFFLQVEGRKRVRDTNRVHIDPFALKSSRITRVLLASPKRGWQLQELAEEAQVSLGLVAKVKRALLEEAFLEERDRRLHLRDPKGLLEAWAAKYQPTGERVAVYTMQKPGEVERSIAQWCGENGVRFALTDLAGAWRLAPSVRYQQSTIYVEGQNNASVVDDVIQALRAKRVDSGANVMLAVPEDPFVLYQSRTVGNIEVASPLQLYLDLRRQPGRGEEAAQEILKREIMPTW